MKLSHPLLTVSFFKTTTETVSVTELDIVRDSFLFKEQLLKGLESSSNMVSLKLKRSCSVIEKILTYQVDTKVVLKDGNTTLFTGYLSDNYSWKVNKDGEQEFQITIEGIGTKLLGKAFLTMSAPSLFYLHGKVFSGANSIVQQICDRAGITIKSGQQISIGTEIKANIDKNMTCKELLGGILLECGYAYYFDENGELCLYKIDCESVTGIPVINEDNLWVVNGNAITLTKKVRQYKQINVSYDEYEEREDVLVYKDISGQDTDQGYPDCNITIKPNAYYPVPLFDVTTVQDMQHLGTNDVSIDDYVRVTSTDQVYIVVPLGDPDADIDGDSYSFVETTVNETSFVEAEDIDKGREVISISNVRGTVEYTGTITQSISQRGAKNIAVVLHNIGNTDAQVTKLQAIADIVDIKSKGIIVAGESAGTEHSENVYSTETKYIHKKEYVQNYANLLVSYYKHCNYSYQFYLNTKTGVTAYPLGSIVHVYDNAFSQLQVDLLLTERSYNDSTSVYQYTGIAVSPFNLSADVDNEQTLVPDKIGVPGPAGPAGDSGTTVTTEYALTLRGDEPSASDWSEERDPNWYAGYTYWYRFKYVSSTETTYSIPALDDNTNDIMNSLLSFNITPSIYSYIKDLRGSNSQSITFMAFSQKYESPVYNWTINGTNYTGSSVVINFTDATAPDSFEVSCTLTSSNNITAGPLYLSVSAKDITVYNDNLGIKDTVPSTTGCIDGDCYVLHSGVNYKPYVNLNGTWVEITDVSLYPEQISLLRDTILASGVNIPNTSDTLYSYFRNIAVQHAQIDTIASSEITLTNTGVIKSSNYAEDQNGNPVDGFKISADGTANFVNSNVVDSVVSGSFTSNPLETQDAMTGSQVTATFGSQAYYNDGYVYGRISGNVPAAVPTTITGSYGSTALSEALVITSDTQRTETRSLVAGTGQTAATTISGTMPVNCNNNISVNGTSIVKQLYLWKGNQTRSSVMQYKNGSGTWNIYSGSVTGLSADKGTTLQARQVVDSSTYSYGSYNSWTTGNLLPNDASVGNQLKQTIIQANNGNLVTTGRLASMFYSQNSGQTWNRVYLVPNLTTSYAMNCLLKGENAIIVVASINGANGGIYRSTDNGVTWTQVLSSADSTNASNIYWGAYGNGEFRLTTLAYRGYYKSTDDGATWTWVSGTEYGPIAYGSGRFVTCADVGVSGFSNYSSAVLSYTNGYFFMAIKYNSTQVSMSANGPVYYSNDGSDWYRTYLFDELGVSNAHIAECSNIIYVNGYYFIIALRYSNSTGCGIWYSDTPYSWTQYSNFSCTNPNLSYIAGRLVYHYGNGNTYVDYYNDIGNFADSDWSISQSGNQSITYNYSNFNVGANLLNSLGGNVATIVNDINAWHTSPTVIPSMSLNPTAYYRFVSFSSPAFDARGYDTQATFNVIFTTFDGTSLNLTSPTSGTYTYNLKWNGSVFNVFLNGAQVGSFDTSDYFEAGASIVFTPETQTDAILVKDVIPKNDSQYSLGILGKEFATGYVDNMYATIYHGGWDVPIITANYTITDNIPVGVMRPYFINSSSTVSLTMPGNSSQQYIVIAYNVIVMALVSAGKVNRYEAVSGGSSISLSWTSSAEPYLLVNVLRIS